MKNIEEKINQAMDYHNQGFNCAQAVALPFCKEFGLDPAFVMRAMEGFGAGMGGRGQTCGALSGAIFLAGLKNSCGDLSAPTSKLNTYEICQGICNRFCEICGSGLCADIKGLRGGPVLLPCDECIKLGVELVAELI